MFYISPDHSCHIFVVYLALFYHLFTITRRSGGFRGCTCFFSYDVIRRKNAVRNPQTRDTATRCGFSSRDERLNELRAKEESPERRHTLR